jgi:DNA polymerase-3 subunit alpha
MQRFSPHNHTEMSNFRLLDCINKLPDLVKRGKDIGLAGLAVTDHETIAQSIRICKLQKENPDFKIGIGDEIYLTNTRDKGIKYYHFILIAKDAIGHNQLRQLSSIAWMNSYWDRGMERVPTLKSELAAVVKKDPGHLIATSACLGGELSSCIVEMEHARKIEDTETANKKHQQIKDFMFFCDDLFGDDFYVEVAPGASKDQIIANNKLAQIAQVFHKKLVIGDDAHYLKRDDRYIHKAYLNSKGGERETDAFYEYTYLQSDEDIRINLEPSIGMLIEEMYANSMEMFNKIEVYDLLHNQTIPSVPVKDYPKQEPKWYSKDYPTLEDMYKSDDIYDRYWVHKCLSEMTNKKLLTKKYWDELEEEARVKRVIGEKLGTNMFKYPITLKYYIDMMWECGSLVGAGRGSSCAALNHYLLGITQLDPIEWNLPFFRYMNEERVELGDIDIDICPSKKGTIVKKIKEERGSRFNPDIDELSRKNLGCTLIATYGTEQTKSAVLTACRGYRSEDYPDGIDNDEAQYIASLIPSERGFLWPLEDVINGNKDKGREPVHVFVKEVNTYPGLLDIIFGIVGLVNKRSSHASGVILFDEDPYEFGCFMRTPKGEIITQYDLHDCEAAGLTKYDFLVTEVQDKLAQAIRFLQEDGVIEDYGINLRPVYDKYFHPNVLPLNDKRIWDAIQNGSVINVFQFDSEVGSQAAKKIKPKTILELSDANGLMRLMTAEKGAETPMEKYIRFKNNLDLWYKEMYDFGLTPKERDYLEPYFKSSYGVPPSQEQLMLMLMDKNICGFTLAEANAARKIVGKKQMSKIPELHQKILDKASSSKLGKYVWENGVGPQMGYSFSIIHALAYSFIGFQTAYIATQWNPIYWDTACLVVNSGSLEDEDDNEYDEDGQPVKKKEQSTDYGKIAKAIGEIINDGIQISLIDINKSDYGFKPDVKNNQILFGMKALNGVGSPIIEQIKANRPYMSFKDFLNKCPLNKTAMISLIKAGAFDNLEQDTKEIEPRIFIMAYYLSLTSEPKKKLNLQNFSGLINLDLIPQELSFQKRVFNFNKYLKAYKWKEDNINYYYIPHEYAIKFYLNNFDPDTIDKVSNGIPMIEQKNWEKIYQKIMDTARDWLKENQQQLLKEVNQKLFKAEWDKYAMGNISAWEMSSLCFYYHDHELKNINNRKYGIIDFNNLPVIPEVDYFFKRNGVQIPIYKLCRIAGTVIGKNDTRHSVVLLTTSGVVNVKLTRDYYAMFNRQISEVNEKGEKKVKEKGWFTRGVKLLVTGYRRDDTFVAKKYKSTGGHQLYKITEVVGRDISLTATRYGMEENNE